MKLCEQMGVCAKILEMLVQLMKLCVQIGGRYGAFDRVIGAWC